MFIFFQLFNFKEKIISFIVIIFVSTLPYYIKSFTFDEYYNGDNFKKIDHINKSKNLNLKNICLKKDDIKNIYKIYFDQNILWLSKHNQFFLNTEIRPCNVILNQRLRGSKKNYDMKKNSASASFIDQDTDFQKVTTFKDKEYKAKNHFLLNGIEGETDININRAGSYNIKTNSDVIFTSISYSKSWKIRGNQNKLTLKNNNGLLEINILDKDFKNFELYYDNTIIKLSIYLFIILSILSYISLSLIILKKNKS